MSEFGQELRRLRRRFGLSQEALAQRAGLSEEAVSLLERGRRAPRMTTLRLLADGMGLAAMDRRRLFGAASVEPEPLPLPLPSFVDPLLGRASEVEFLTDRLLTHRARLTTVTGPGGVGKTRTAVAVAETVAPRFADGVRWVPLASLADSGPLLPAVAAALGLRDANGSGPESVAEHLRDRRTLLVVDNGEHLLDECRRLCAEILRQGRDVQILLTSRVRLGLAGETVVVLPPLAVPDSSAGPAEVARTAGTRLFLDRAQLTRPEELTPAELEAITRICQRLDGVPLAIELAAARLSVLSIPDLAATLEQSPGLLDPADTERLTEAVVGWSYRLLTEAEQTLFQRLSVFAGFTQEAAAAVATDAGRPAEVLSTLSSLLTKSLVYRTRDSGGHARFRLLHVIRQFAQARLADAVAGDPAAVTGLHERHARYYTDLAEHAAARFAGPASERWLAVIDGEVGNIRAALSWAVNRDVTLALRLVGVMWRWCYRRGRYTEGLAWADRALADREAAPPEIRAAALSGAGMLAFLTCDYPGAQDRIAECLTLYEELGDHAGVGWALARLGSLARERGDTAAATELHTRALRLAEEAGDRHQAAAQVNFLAFAAWVAGDLDTAGPLAERALAAAREVGDAEGVVWALMNCGVVARYSGDLTGARMLLTEGLDRAEEIGYPEGLAWALNQLGAVSRLEGDLDRARSQLQASLAEHRLLGDRWREASVESELASLAVAAGDFGAAAAHLGAAGRLRVEIGVPVPAVEQPELAAAEAATAAALGTSYAAAMLLDRSRPQRRLVRSWS